MEGEVIISAGSDEHIYVWEPQSLTVLAHFTENSSIHKQSIIYSSGLIISSQRSKTLLHYYIFGKEGPDKKSGVLEEISSLANKDSLVLAGTVHGTLILWDTHTSEVIKIWKPHHSKVVLVHLDDWIISTSDDATIKIFRTISVIEGNTNPYKELAINVLPVTGMKVLGNTFFTCSKDKSFNIFYRFQLQSQKFYQTSLNCLEISESSSEYYLGGDDGCVYLSKTGAIWEVDTKPISNIKITSSENYLIVSSQLIYVLNSKNGTKIKTFSLHSSEVVCLLCVSRPADFASGSLSHHSVKPLKKTVDNEPGVINFEFVREIEAKDVGETQVIVESNTEELENLKKANSILYRLWVEHCS